jgi:hypothetical protein
VESVQIWSSVEVILDSQFVAGEAKHKFADFYRTCISDATFTRETKITFFSADSDAFDSVFEPDEMPPRLVTLLIKNTARVRAGVRTAAGRVGPRPFFQIDTTFECFPLDRYLEVFDHDGRPTLSAQYLEMEAPATRLSFRKGNPVRTVAVREICEFASEDSTIDPPSAVGDCVIFQRRFHATIASNTPALDLEQDAVPDCSEVFDRDSASFLPVKCCFAALWIRSGFYRVIHRILGAVIVDGVNCGFGAVQQLHERGAQARVGRLARIAEDDGNSQVFVAPRLRDAVAEWRRRAPAIPRLLEQKKPLSAQTAFGQADGAAAIRAWIDEIFPEALFPLVEETRSQQAMD